MIFWVFDPQLKYINSNGHTFEKNTENFNSTQLSKNIYV